MSVRVPTLDEIEALLDADDLQEKMGTWTGKIEKCEALPEADMMDLCDRVFLMTPQVLNCARSKIFL
jgi:hypothetical protein